MAQFYTIKCPECGEVFSVAKGVFVSWDFSEPIPEELLDETPFNLDELMNADEVIVTSSGQFCMATCEIDGKPVGGKSPEIIKKLQDALLEEFLNETNVEEYSVC